MIKETLANVWLAVKVVVITLFLAVTSLPACITDSKTYEAINSINESYKDVVPNKKFINNRLFDDMSYVKVYNYMYTTVSLVYSTQNEGFNKYNHDQYYECVKAAQVWNNINIDRNSAINELKDCILLLHSSPIESAMRLQRVFSQPALSLEVIVKGICYDIRYKEKVLFYLLILIDISIILLTGYFITERLLIENNVIEFDEDENEDTELEF